VTADQLAEAIAVAVLLAQAVVVWLVVGVLAASLLLLAVVGTVTVGVRALWRAAAGPRSRLSARLPASQPSSDSSPTEPGERRTAPRWKEAA
jgi:hypothetical protein